MALSQGNSALASDYNSVRTAVYNFYRVTVGSNPTLATMAAGDLMDSTIMADLRSKYDTAVSRHRTRYDCSTYNSNNRRTARFNNRAANGTVHTGYNSVAK